MKKCSIVLIVLFVIALIQSITFGEEKIIVEGFGIQRVLSNSAGRLRSVEIVNEVDKRTVGLSGPEFVITWGEGKSSNSDDFELLSLESTPKGVVARLKNKELNLQAEITYSGAERKPWLYKQIRFINIGHKPFLLRTVELEHLKVKEEKITYAVKWTYGASLMAEVLGGAQIPKVPDLSNWGQPVFTESLWFGVEFPATLSSADKENYIYLRHHPGIELAPREDYQTKRAVLGATLAGKSHDSIGGLLI